MPVPSVLLLGAGFDLVAQLLFLVLDEPADHLPPKRFAEVRRHATLEDLFITLTGRTLEGGSASGASETTGTTGGADDNEAKTA